MSEKIGTLWVIPTPIGNLDDITIRALRVLKETTVIAAEDTRKTAQLLSHFGILSGKELVSHFQGNEAMRVEPLLAKLLLGQDVALVSDAGTPLVSDPGERLIQAAIQKNIKISVLPGPCAAITALVGSGFSTEEFIFCGFPPPKKEERYRLWNRLKSFRLTAILYESKRRLAQTLSEIGDIFGLHQEISVARELSKIHEEYQRGTIESVMEYYRGDVKGEICIVIKASQIEDALKTDVSDSLEENIRQEIQNRLKAGQAAQTIATFLALRYGKSKRLMYKLVLMSHRDIEEID